MPFWKCYYHVVWATKYRASLISPVMEPIIFAALHRQAESLHCEVFALNGVADHVHIALNISPSLAVATCIGHLKGASSRAVNTGLALESRFQWQEGYSVMSFGEKALPDVIAYINHQKQRHADQMLNTYLERME